MGKVLKIAFFSSQKYDKEQFSKYCPEEYKIDFFSQQLNIKSCKLAEGYDVICCFVNDSLDEDVLMRISSFNIKLVALRCAGFNNVNLEAAKKHEIQVVRVPAYSPESVAEHCFALVLGLSRKTHKAYNRVKENNFDLNGLLGFNIHKKTIGIIGLGKIGQAFSKIAHGFGAKVLFYDPIEKSKIAKYTELDQLIRESDIISLHCPLNEETHHIVNDSTLNTMKDGVMLINTSRGGLIDTQACIEALKSRKIGYLGLDVYEQESELFFQDLSSEIVKDDVFQRLLTFPNVLITGHQGFFTKEALKEIVLTTFENIQEYVDNKKLSNEVL